MGPLPNSVFGHDLLIHLSLLQDIYPDLVDALLHAHASCLDQKQLGQTNILQLGQNDEVQFGKEGLVEITLEYDGMMGLKAKSLKGMLI